MNLRQHVIDLLESYATAKRLSLSRVSTLVFNHGDMARRLREGSDITVGRAEAAVNWFDANWPEETPWPEGIARPSLVAQAQNTEAA